MKDGYTTGRRAGPRTERRAPALERLPHRFHAGRRHPRHDYPLAMNVTGAIAVTEASQVAEGRRLALWLASSLDFSEERERARSARRLRARDAISPSTRAAANCSSGASRTARRRAPTASRSSRSTRGPASRSWPCRSATGIRRRVRSGTAWGRSSGRPTRSTSIPTPPEPSSPRACGAKRPAAERQPVRVTRWAPSTSPRRGEPVCGDDWALAPA